MDETQPAVSGTHRRAVLKTAAWAVPAIGLAVATPLASASITEPSASVPSSTSGLLSFPIQNTQSSIQSQAIVTLPATLRIDNGRMATNQQVTVTTVIGRPPGINIPVGRARGFFLSGFNSVATTSGETTNPVYQSAPIIGQYGFPVVTTTVARTLTFPGSGVVEVPLNFGLAGVSTGVQTSTLASFPVTFTVDFGGSLVKTASSWIQVPVGAGIL